MAKVTEVADAFRRLMSDVSQWFDSQKNYYVNMLKVLYRDHIKDTFKLCECSKTMDIINLLILYGHLNSTNLTLLYETMKLTQLFGLENTIKDQHPDLIQNDIKNIVIKEFTLHRQRLVKLGMELDPKGIQDISGLYDVAEEHAVDSWCLIMELEHKSIICEENMDPFIKNLQKLKLQRAVNALTEGEGKQENGMIKNNGKVKKRQNINGNVQQVRTEDCLKLKVEKSVSQGQPIVVKVIKTVACDINADQFKAEWTHPSGEITITKFEEDENGEYSTIETCSNPGDCRLDVSAGGVALRRSPMTVEIVKDGLVKSFPFIETCVTDIVVYDDWLLVSCEKNNIFKFKLSEAYNHIINTVTLPEGVKVNRMYKMKNGNIVFIDKGNKCIKVCNLNGKEISRIGQGLLKDPRGIYVNETANVVFVTDSIQHWYSTNGCVYMFDICNTSQANKTFGKGILKDPVGIQVNETSNVLYVADSGSFVYMFNIDNGNIQKITQEGRVCDIALPHKGNLFVFGHTEIKLFSNEGKFIKDIKTEYMQSPLVVVDEDDNIIVSGFCDYPNCLQIFSSNGNVLKTITFEDNYKFAAIPIALCVISHYPRKIAVGLQYNIAQMGSSIKIIHY